MDTEDIASQFVAKSNSRAFTLDQSLVTL